MIPLAQVNTGRKPFDSNNSSKPWKVFSVRKFLASHDWLPDFFFPQMFMAQVFVASWVGRWIKDDSAQPSCCKNGGLLCQKERCSSSAPDLEKNAEAIPKTSPRNLWTTSQRRYWNGDGSIEFDWIRKWYTKKIDNDNTLPKTSGWK